MNNFLKALNENQNLISFLKDPEATEPALNPFAIAKANKESIVAILKRAGFQDLELTYNKKYQAPCFVKFGSFQKNFKTWGDAMGYFSAMFGKL